jgi:hypothetical protein
MTFDQLVHHLPRVVSWQGQQANHLYARNQVRILVMMWKVVEHSDLVDKLELLQVQRHSLDEKNS